MCYCIERINEQVRNAHRADSAFIERPGWSSVLYRPITRKLEPSRRTHQERVDWKFCPFCGEPRESPRKRKN